MAIDKKHLEPPEVGQGRLEKGHSVLTHDFEVLASSAVSACAVSPPVR